MYHIDYTAIYTAIYSHCCLNFTNIYMLYVSYLRSFTSLSKVLAVTGTTVMYRMDSFITASKYFNFDKSCFMTSLLSSPKISFNLKINIYTKNINYRINIMKLHFFSLMLYDFLTTDRIAWSARHYGL